MNGKNLCSQSLDLLRFPLAVVVLVIHTFNSDGFTLHQSVVSFDDMPFMLLINRFIDAFLRGQSVPIYFLISGFVFFLGVDFTKDVYYRKLKNRVKTLLIPYLIWNMVAVLFELSKRLPCFSSLLPNIRSVSLDFSLSAALNSFWNAKEGIFGGSDMVSQAVYNIHPQNAPLWFVRDLMIVILCAPAMYWLLKHTRYYAVLVSGVLWFASGYYNWGHAGQLITALFFFGFGAYMSVSSKDMMSQFGRFFKSSMILYPLLGVLHILSAYYMPEVSDLIKKLNVFAGLLFAYNMSAYLLAHGVCKVDAFLASAGFFVYVSHYMICGNFVKLLFLMFRPQTGLGALAVYLSDVVITLSICLAVFYLLRRYMPGLLKVMTGKR